MRIFLFSFLLDSSSVCAMQTSDSHLDLSLHFAAEQGFLFGIKVLTRRGYSIDARDGAGATPMHWAAISGQTQAVKRLFELGADPNLEDQHGATPLHFASWARYPKTVLMLLGCGSLVNVCKHSERRTPLHDAIVSGVGIKRSCIEVVKILLEHGADVNARDVWGDYPRDIAKRYGECEIIPLIEEVIRGNTLP